MFKRIAVPLDGSALAEKILPFAIRFASLLKAELLLLHTSYIPHNLAESLEDKQQSELILEPYLEKIKAKITDPGEPLHLNPEQVLTHLEFNRSPYEIAEAAQEQGADLIVMMTHGRGGFLRLVMGGIAANTLHHSRLPVILLRPREDKHPLQAPLERESVSLGRWSEPLLVTLDGSPEAEVALPPALALAGQLEATLHLLRVVWPVVPVQTGSMGVGFGNVSSMTDTAQEIDWLEKEAVQYLEQIKDRLHAQAPQVKIKTTVQVGAPADCIISEAYKLEALLVLMATHARHELGQIILGSVADAVVRRGNLPVMLIRIR